ncbi:exonuclease SbcCD subunit D [Candidatus Woesearchaeota archaeon]|nr:exonuclease SbcCD subunit D [Candidatus Woesearchaeota archaeon]
MRFIHIADCHIGGWRDEKMSELGVLAFKKVVSEAVSKYVDFVLISGDLFNSALPPIDKLKEAVIALKKLKQAGIKCYVIPGSHDFSPSGKTMIDVLEHADLLVDVFKGDVVDDVLKLNFTVDSRSGAKITGIIGKKGMLDRKYYEKLDKESLELAKGFKIFMFHTALTELKPPELEKIESSPVSILPSGFDYYAGGHVHIVEHRNFEGHRNVIYPGALFPNNFAELEKFKNGGYCFYDEGKISFHPVNVKDVIVLNFDCDGRIVSDVEKEIMNEIKEIDASNKIITIRVKGELLTGKPSDIPFNQIFGMLYHKGAYFVMKSTSLASSKEVEIVPSTASSVEEAEEKVIKDNSTPEEEKLIRNLIKVFSLEKQDGETKYNFEKRVIEETRKVIDL